MEHLEQQIRAFHHTPWRSRNLQTFLEATGATMMRYVEINGAIERRRYDRLRQEFWLADDQRRAHIARRMLERISPREEQLIHDPRKNDYAWGIWICRLPNGTHFSIRTTQEQKPRYLNLSSQEATQHLVKLLTQLLPHPLDDLADGE